MAHVALIGASGRASSRILKELSDRGHTVTAITRNPEKIAAPPKVTAKRGDVWDKNGLTALLRGHDAVVSAVPFAASDAHALIEAARASGVKRYVVVGGTGSLEVAPGKCLLDELFPLIDEIEKPVIRARSRSRKSTERLPADVQQVQGAFEDYAIASFVGEHRNSSRTFARHLNYEQARTLAPASYAMANNAKTKPRRSQWNRRCF
jgi:hypothetical protein